MKVRFTTELIDKSRDFAINKLKSISDSFHYHNLSHTVEVVEAAWKIGLRSDLSRDTLENIVVAAWFHDLGYACGRVEHESASVAILTDKLEEWKIAPEKIKEIGRLIMATKMPQAPEDLPAKVLCDADLFHLCQPDFVKKSESLRREINQTCQKNIGPRDWIRMNVEFLKGHCYFTEYGKKVLSPLKDKVISQVHRKIDHS